MRLPYSSICRFRSYLLLNKSLFSSGEFISEEKSLTWTEPAGHTTPISLYNSICKKKVRFKTRLKGIVTWYSCGPTVYDSAHIGHACCYIYQDVIRRVMEDMFNLNVMMVMGVTDIDDKIIAAANSSGKEPSAISRHYEKEFFSDLSKLNVRGPSVAARVTDYVPQIISFVQRLYDKGFAYTAHDGSVYFRVDKFEGYGKLHPAEGKPNETEEVQDKESKRDFALWKGAKPGEPYWSSPWGDGRPGWHIECSTIASCLLGDEIDLHSGGLDLMFPHHENEEAQSCCHHGVAQWVNYWLHTGHLRLAGDVKMSKSLKNTVSISEFLEKYSSEELRMFCLLTRYRYGIEFSDLMMDSAVSVCRKLDNFLNDCNTCIKDSSHFGSIDEPLLLKCLNETETFVIEALANDFDTPRAISHLLHLVSTVNKMLHSTPSVGEMSPVIGLAAVRNYTTSLLKILGCLADKQDGIQSEMDSLLNSSVNFRSQVRNAALKITKEHPKESKELKKELLGYCDDYRKVLLVDGVEIKDLGEKSSWNTLRKI